MTKLVTARHMLWGFYQEQPEVPKQTALKDCEQEVYLPLLTSTYMLSKHVPVLCTLVYPRQATWTVSSCHFGCGSSSCQELERERDLTHPEELSWNRLSVDRHTSWAWVSHLTFQGDQGGHT